MSNGARFLHLYWLKEQEDDHRQGWMNCWMKWTVCYLCTHLEAFLKVKYDEIITPFLPRWWIKNVEMNASSPTITRSSTTTVSSDFTRPPLRLPTPKLPFSSVCFPSCLMYYADVTLTVATGFPFPYINVSL